MKELFNIYFNEAINVSTIHDVALGNHQKKYVFDNVVKQIELDIDNKVVEFAKNEKNKIVENELHKFKPLQFTKKYKIDLQESDIDRLQHELETKYKNYFGSKFSDISINKGVLSCSFIIQRPNKTTLSNEQIHQRHAISAAKNTDLKQTRKRSTNISNYFSGNPYKK